MGKITKTPDHWIRNKADELAVERHGCKWSQSRGDHVVDFIHTHLRLYEGHWMGQPFQLMDWQEDAVRRIFSWVRWNEMYGKWVRRFKKAGLWVPKKNGKSPIAAAIGLYLFIADGDGQQENKVFTTARDGKQAEIVQQHAIQMCRLSPALAQRCRINKLQMMITDEITASTYKKIAGDNVASQEGLNGSAIQDELHVVPRKLAETLEYMGASRPESLQFTVSTAGSDPESYGKEQFDYGESVNRGDVDDFQFFHQAYGIPSDMPDRDVLKEETLRKANPSVDKIIDIDELKTSGERARKNGPRAWQNFKMYRLNQWQRTASPWLSVDTWKKGDRATKLEDFEGQEVSIGCDLAAIRDFATLVLTFHLDEEPDTFYQFPIIWVAEQYALENSHLAGFERWIEQGELIASPGNQIDEALIRDKLEEINDRFDVLAFTYDPYRAKNLLLWAEETLGWAEENGILIPFNQTLSKFAAPTGEFERLMIAQKILHPPNACVDWQIGHARVKEDGNNNKRPLKPESSEVKKIDTVVASIMSLWAAQAGIEAVPVLNYYEDNPLEMG